MKLVSLISGGIDSAVSTALALEQGAEIIAVHFSEKNPANEKKTENILKILGKKFKKNIPLLIVPHEKNLQEILKNCEPKFSCILCKRMMLRIAERIAVKEKAVGVLMGDSLGQVASQTLSNLSSESSAVKIPIIRPLIGLDKIEIEKLGRKFGSFQESIQPAPCCTAVPSKPATKSNAKKIEAMEEKLDLNELVSFAVNNLKRKEISWN